MPRTILPKLKEFLGRNKKRLLVISTSVLLGLGFAGYLSRNFLVEKYVEAKVRTFNQRTGSDLRVGRVGFEGFSTLVMEDVLLPDPPTDTLMAFSRLTVNINLFKAIFGKLIISDLQIDFPSLNLSIIDTVSNFNPLLERTKNRHPAPSQEEKKGSTLSQKAGATLDVMFDLLPSNLKVEGGHIQLEINENTFNLSFPSFEVRSGAFADTVAFTAQGRLQAWIFKGSLNKGDRNLSVYWYQAGNEPVTLSYFHKGAETRLCFDTLFYAFNNPESHSNRVSINGVASVKGAGILDERISPEPVVFEELSFNYAIHLEGNRVELDSSSRAQFNRLSFNPFLRYDLDPPHRLTGSIRKPSFPSPDLFSSLPPGLFDNLAGMQTTGMLDFDLYLDLLLDQPDSIQFRSNLRGNRFGILKYGKTFLPFINEPFDYTAYENGIPLRTFPVGDANPNFRPLAALPDLLKNSVLTSEDGQFFYHRGFMEEAIREAISHNLKRGKFARGGSTISMQLVKNIYLNRHKNLVRKLEEMLIVWLIENNRLVTKERMFEVYLNIIEWGPGVYGANEAARYYFNKDVSALSYGECIFLASIIPRPKKFFYQFDRDGLLKPYAQKFFGFVSGRMLKKGSISQELYDGLHPEIRIEGPARNLLIRQDSIPLDSLEFFFPPEETDPEFIPAD